MNEVQDLVNTELTPSATSRFRAAVRESVACGALTRAQVKTHVRRALVRAKVEMAAKEYVEAGEECALAGDLLGWLGGL